MHPHLRKYAEQFSIHWKTGPRFPECQPLVRMRNVKNRLRGNAAAAQHILATEAKKRNVTCDRTKIRKLKKLSLGSSDVY